MNRTFNLLFSIKKNKIKSDGTAPIYLRITIDGVPKEISAKRSIHPDQWDNKHQKVSGNSIETKSLNAYLKTLEQQVYEAHHEVLKDKEQATSSVIKAKLQGTDRNVRTLVPIFKDHNNRIKELIGK